MARKLIVEIVGDTSNLEKSYRSAERGTKRFGQSVEKAGRGAVVASVGFRGLGRAVGFASASFLGGAGIVAAITSTVQAAEEAQRVLGQTRNAVLRSGLSWQQYSAHIQAASLATAKLSGFDDEQLLATFSNLVRRTGDVNKALALNALAANVARGRNISLEQASGLVLKASIGNVGALRRLGISISKNATALQALDLLQRKYAGSAAAYGRTAAGAQDRFRVALQNFQETLGAQLLPSIATYLNKGADWLNQSKNQQEAAQTLHDVIVPLAAGFKLLAQTTVAATDAYRKYRELLGKGGDSKGGSFFGNLFASLPEQLGYFKKQIDVFQEYLGLAHKAAKATVPPGLAGPRGTPGTAGGQGPLGLAGPLTLPPPPKRVTSQQRNTWFDAMINRQLGRVQDITTLKGQIARLGQISQLIRGRMAATKDATRWLTLEDQLLDVLRTQRQKRTDLSDLIKQQAQDAADAAALLKQKAKDAADAAKAARQAAIDTKMGWLDFAVERADATKTIKDDVKAQQDIIAFLTKRMRQEGRTLELVRGIWEARQKIKDLNKSKSDVDPLAGLMQVSSSRLAGILAAGTGLDARGRRILGANIAGAEIQPLHVHVNIDGREVGRAVTKDQARTGRRTASQTSGRRG